jgi:RNA polymerase sigma-70 factor (ECF subfamily)
MSWYPSPTAKNEPVEDKKPVTASRDVLIALLLTSYPELRRKLAALLGSTDLANEALQDTYIRLQRTEILDEIRSPRSYLFRMAINIARNRNRAEARHLAAADIETLINIPDDAPGPQRAVEARLQLAAVENALQQLPARRRQIFRRAWVDGTAHEAIAVEFGIAVRTVRHELQLATEYLHRATKEKSVAELQFRLSQVSYQ